MRLKIPLKCLTLVSSMLLVAMVGKSQTSPVIASQFPVSYTNTLTLFVGANPTFTVSVTNTPTVFYQWVFNGSAITDATNASFTLTNAQLNNAGAYACVATNSAGGVTNAGWTIAIIPAPTAPYPQTILAADPVGYWRLNEAPDNGAGNQGTICQDYVGGNNGIYTNVLLAQQPGYSQVTEPTESAVQFGSVAPNNSDANSILGIDFTAPAGINSNFSVEAWVNGVSGQIGGAGIISKGFGGTEQFALDAHSGFRFYVRDAGSTSHGAQSTILPDGNWHHLVGVCDENNGVVSLYVDGKLAASVTVLQGKGIRAVTNAVLIGARSSTATSGNNYQFDGLINDVAIYHYALTPAQVATHYFAVTEVPPGITQQPVAITNVALNGSVTVPVTVVGTSPLFYQWFDETTGNYLPAQTNAALVLSNIVAADTYYLTASNAFGSITSTPVILTFKPVLVSQLPATYTNVLTLFAGVSPTFSISVDSVEPLTYQWSFNGSPIGGATSASYTLTNVQTVSSGIYACVATSATASVTNLPLTVSVISAPTAPYPQSVLAANPVGYWRLNEGPDDGNGDQGTICQDYVGGNNGIYTNVTLAQQPGYSQATEPTEPAVEFGETGISLYDSDANSIQGIDFSAPTNANSNFTIEAWVNGFTGQISGAGIVSKGTGGGGEQFAMDVYLNIFRFYIRDASGNSHDAQSTVQPDENWHHVVGVCNETAGTISLYVDGVLAGNTAFNTNLGVQASSSPMLISSRSSTPSSGNHDQFYGYINDVAVYNYALTPAQISSQYTAVGGTIVPYLAPAPPAITNVTATMTLTIPATAIGTPPIGYVWTNVTTGAILSSGTANATALDATLTQANIPLSWNGNQLELIVTNAYGTTNSFVTLTVANPVNPQPTNIVVTASSGQLTLSWPTDHTGWRLQAQTNNGATGLSTNWFDVNGATATNLLVIPVSPNNGSVFYRLVYP